MRGTLPGRPGGAFPAPAGAGCGEDQRFGRTVLPSGAAVVTEEMPRSRSAAIAVWVKTGSRDEPPGRRGSAHFIEHLMFKGTTTRSASMLSREIDSIGGHLDAFTSREYTCYYLNLLVDHLERGMDMLADIILRSTFPPAEVERERQVILEEIKMSEDNPEDCTYELLVQRLWPRSPLGRPILGRRETIERITRAGLQEFRRRFYRAPNVVFAAAGGITHDCMVRLWRRHFAFTRRRESRRSRRVPPRFEPGFYTKERDLEQTHLFCGSRGLSQGDPRRYTLYVLNSILGGSMSSRLFQEIREKRGLAYAVYSSHASFRDTGLFSIGVGTSPHLAARVVRLIRREIDRICSRAPSKREVAVAKDHLKGNLILGLESSGHRMMKLAKQEIYFGRPCSIDETIAGVEEVTPARVRDLAGEIFHPGSLAWAAVGSGASLAGAGGAVK